MLQEKYGAPYDEAVLVAAWRFRFGYEYDSVVMSKWFGIESYDQQEELRKYIEKKYPRESYEKYLGRLVDNYWLDYPGPWF